MRRRLAPALLTTAATIVLVATVPTAAEAAEAAAPAVKAAGVSRVPCSEPHDGSFLWHPFGPMGGAETSCYRGEGELSVNLPGITRFCATGALWVSFTGPDSNVWHRAPARSCYEFATISVDGDKIAIERYGS
ncbi:hypothetical protein [Spirillospora sp. NPDC047279]|uniref:hypothetical protein n=1 Tax=Spirillospora sp. NPDC047279 TaxID=3155478 RepID=UPI0033EABDBE